MGGASRKWITSLIHRKKQQPTDHREDGKQKKGGLWRSVSEGSMLSEKLMMTGTYMATSEASESAMYALNDPALAAAMATIIRAPPKNFTAIKREWAAIRLQTTFRAFLARRALRALKAIVRIQSIFRGQQVRKQADVTLKCMQALVRVQAQVRAHSMGTLEGDEVGNLFGKKPNSTNSFKQAEKGWCDSPGTLEDVMAKLEVRQKGVLRRGRAMAYSLPRQYARASASPISRIGMPANSIRNDGPDKGNMGWSRWKNRLVDESCYFDPDSVKVRRNNVTTRVSVTSSLSNPISESLYSESSTSTSSASASLTPISRILSGERTEESKLLAPSYMNLTESAKAKQAGRFLCQELPGKQAIEDMQFHTKSMMMSAREARSVSGSIPSVNFTKDLYPTNGIRQTRMVQRSFTDVTLLPRAEINHSLQEQRWGNITSGRHNSCQSWKKLDSSMALYSKS